MKVGPTPFQSPRLPSSAEMVLRPDTRPLNLPGFTCVQETGEAVVREGAVRPETHLHVAFCDIKRGDAGVGDTARKDTTEHALGIVARIVRDGAEVAEGRGVSRADKTGDTSTTYRASHFPEGDG